MPNKQKVTRKLRAIMSADVKGYSFLMADDEVHTIHTLKDYRNLMADLIKQHSGRVVDNPGDNLLAEFSSAVDAVECAVQIQKKLKKENAKFVENKRLEFRIGVNIGDVVHDGDRIYGSGVNVAARIEGIADPVGICISRNTYDQVKDKLDLRFVYLGEHEVKNITEPVRVYKVLMVTEAPKPLVEEKLELPGKPSIAVLPFANMSGDPGQEYFSDGLTEQIINGLCKVSNLFVIARNSSFAYKGKVVSVKQIAKELGVRYILEGSVQRAGDRVRITAQLIDATTDYHMWSENYDRDLEDIFQLQDEITLRIVFALGISLIYGEQAQLYTAQLGNIHAYEKLNQGLECYYRNNKQSNNQARRFFKQAANLEEGSAIIHTVLGWTHLNDFQYSWSDSPPESFVFAEQYALKAIDLDNSIDTPRALLSYIHLIKRNYEKATFEINKAVDLNPNGADSLAHCGFITCCGGNPEKGVSLIKKAFRLNPIPPPWYYHYLGEAYYFSGKHVKAINVLMQSLTINPDGLFPRLGLTASYVEINDINQAKLTAKDVLEIDPNISLKKISISILYNNQDEVEIFINNLRKAGLPD